jgi:hypothetical protein
MMEVLKSEMWMKGRGVGTGKEGRREGKRLVDGDWSPLAFPGRFCRRIP